MPAFSYQALDTAGKQKKGVIEGDTAKQIRTILRQQELTPLSINEINRQEKGSTNTGGFHFAMRKLKPQELALLTRQLATLVRAGLPLEECLGTVADQNEKNHIKSTLMAIRAGISEGRSLATALQDFPASFPDYYIATVDAGEQSGHLSVVLDRLADDTESRHHMHSRFMMALLYPAIITLTAIAVVIALLTYVVPQVVHVFESINQTLPPLTLGMISVSEFLQNHGFLLLIIIMGGLLAFSIAIKKPAIRTSYHRFLLKVPVLGRLILGGNTARFARTFSILLASGVPAIEGMRIAAQVLSNLPMRNNISTAAERVREGSSIYNALKQGNYFPPMTLHLMASGEASGNLEEMLERAAINEERELETYLSTLLSLFEPLLLLVMGGVVLIIVLAILLPIFDLNQLVK
jgi:general secretion pathway protein F